MSTRTIMIFPEFENMEIIEDIRKKYDPLAGLVRPHITLVFPFESQMSNRKLRNILDKRLEGMKPFELTLCGFDKQENTFGNYLFLQILKGCEEISYIHHIFYANEFKKFDAATQYIPHMTVGKLPTVESLNDAFRDVEIIKNTFHTIVHKISVEEIGEHEESIIIIEKELA